MGARCIYICQRWQDNERPNCDDSRLVDLCGNIVCLRIQSRSFRPARSPHLVFGRSQYRSCTLFWYRPQCVDATASQCFESSELVRIPPCSHVYDALHFSTWSRGAVVVDQSRHVGALHAQTWNLVLLGMCNICSIPSCTTLARSKTGLHCTDTSHHR